MKRWRKVVAGLVVLAAWWLYGVDYIGKQHAYRLPVLFMCAVVVGGGFHIRALYRFHHMAKVLRRDESVGLAEPGSTIFATNQQFRYIVRVIESLIIFTVAVVLFISVNAPQVVLNPNYRRLVLTYFVGSVMATGYLTIRDLLVLNKVRKLNAKEDAVILQSVPSEKD